MPFEKKQEKSEEKSAGTLAELKAKQKQAILDSLGAGAFITKAVEAAGIAVPTYYAWRRADPEFDEACEAALAARVGRVEDALYAKAVSGHVTACIFWLCNRVPDRWQHVQRIVQEHRGQIAHLNVDLESEIKAVAQRLRRELDGTDRLDRN